MRAAQVRQKRGIAMKAAQEVRRNLSQTSEKPPKRTAGMLMPIFSLPSPYGIGTLGKAAYRFVDFLRAAGCSVWQVLPLEPTAFGNSPYSSCATGAFNPYFIDLESLEEDGLLTHEELAPLAGDNRRVDYGKQYRERIDLLRLAFSRFPQTDEAWQKFQNIEKYRDFALFMAQKTAARGAPCRSWPQPEYHEEQNAALSREHADEIALWQFTQFLFLRQWQALKQYANEMGVKIMGDMPYYVSSDSVEFWKYKHELFQLDKKGNPAAQAGVPPDAFSEDGQLWGNPVYRWNDMGEAGYAWWNKRLETALSTYDILRIDHFIGTVRYYSIPKTAKTARSGKWRKGPGAKLFENFQNAPIVAEDLGIVTPRVRRELDKTGFAGMKILQEAFDGNPENGHKPSNFNENIVAYTSTQDSETLFARVSELKGQWRTRLIADLKEECKKAGIACHTENNQAICDSIIELLFASKANTVIVPMQDILHLGNEARINAPSTVSDENWSFRFTADEFSREAAEKISELAKKYGRA